MRKHSIVAFVWSEIRNVIRLIVKESLFNRCCTTFSVAFFHFSLQSYLPLFLYSFMSFCHLIFCFQQNENEDGSEDEIGGRVWDGFEFNRTSTVGNLLLLVVVVVVVVVRITRRFGESCRRGAMLSRCQGRDGFYLHLELLALRWNKQKRHVSISLRWSPSRYTF